MGYHTDPWEWFSSKSQVITSVHENVETQESKQLPVGKENGATPLGNNLAVSSSVKHIHTCNRHFHSYIPTREIKAHFPTETCAPMFKATLFTIAKK